MNSKIRARLVTLAVALVTGALVVGVISPAVTANAATSKCTGVISGTVQNPQGKGLAGIQVKFTPFTGKSFSIYTKTDGSYRQGSLCPIRFDVDVNGIPKGYEHDYAQTKATNGHNEIIDFVLKPVGRLKVNVANATIYRDPRVLVKAANGNLKELINEWSSASSGYEAILVPGTYRVYVKPKFAKDKIKVTSASPRTVTITQGKTTTVGFSIDKGGAIKGKVKPSPKYCVKGKCGYLTVKSDRGFTAKATMNKYGSFLIKNLPPGKYKVHMVANRTSKKKSADYYRGCKKSVAVVKVKQNKTTKLKTTTLAKSYKGKPFKLPWWTTM